MLLITTVLQGQDVSVKDRIERILSRRRAKKVCCSHADLLLFDLPALKLKDGVADEEANDDDDNEDIVDDSDSADESEKGSDGRPDDLAIIQGLFTALYQCAVS